MRDTFSLDKLNKLEERWVRENALKLLHEKEDLGIREKELSDVRQMPKVKEERAEIAARLESIKKEFKDVDLIALPSVTEMMKEHPDMLFDGAMESLQIEKRAGKLENHPDTWQLKQIALEQQVYQLNADVKRGLDNIEHEENDPIAKTVVLTEVLADCYSTYQRRIAGTTHNNPAQALYDEAQKDMWDSMGYRVGQLFYYYRSLKALELIF